MYKQIESYRNPLGVAARMAWGMLRSHATQTRQADADREHQSRNYGKYERIEGLAAPQTDLRLERYLLAGVWMFLP